MSLIGALLAGGQGLVGQSIASDLISSAESAKTTLQDIGAGLSEDSGFEGYGFTTGVGTGSVTSNGTTNFGAERGSIGTTGEGMVSSAATTLGDAASGLGTFQSGMLGNASTAAGNALQDPATREAEIYQRMMAVQNPMLDRQQAAQQAREFAMGRSGIRGSQFGGTAEDAAMARARAEASNQAYLNAMGQAQQELVNQGNLASQFGQMGVSAAGTQGNIGGTQGQIGNAAFVNSYAPIETQIKAAQAAANNAAMNQTGQLTGLGYEAQLGLGGIQSLVNAQSAAAGLEAELLSSALTAGTQAVSGIGGTIGSFMDGKIDPGGLISGLLFG